MSITPLTPRQQTLIVNNLVKACEDITKLNRTGYGFIYVASGFIAHYNLYGFQDAYREPGSLREDILANRQMNMWLNFHPGDENYEYYRSKASVYSKLCERLADVKEQCSEHA